MSAWEGAIGELLFPKLDWKVAISPIHSAAVGFDGPYPYLVMDILRFYSRIPKQIRKYKSAKLEDAASRILPTLMTDQQMSVCTVKDRTDILAEQLQARRNRREADAMMPILRQCIRAGN